MASENEKDSRTTVAVPLPYSTPDTDAGRLVAVQEVIEYVIRDRLSILRDEAETISNDMQALALRLTNQGHTAELTDIRSNRWYRTAAQLSCLRKLYDAVCDICGTAPKPIFAEVEPESERTRTTGTLDAISDEVV